LPTSVDVDVLSCVYPPDCIMVTEPSFGRDDEVGWYYGVKGTRLIWLPDDIRSVWLATGRQRFGSRYLVLGQNANNVTILDMEDYLRALPDQGAWREGGIRYVDKGEAVRASALASASELPNYAFGVPYLEVPEVQEQHQVQRQSTPNHNHLYILLQRVIQDLHSFCCLILRLLLSVFGFA